MLLLIEFATYVYAEDPFASEVEHVPYRHGVRHHWWLLSSPGHSVRACQTNDWDQDINSLH